MAVRRAGAREVVVVMIHSLEARPRPRVWWRQQRKRKQTLLTMRPTTRLTIPGPGSNRAGRRRSVVRRRARAGARRGSWRAAPPRDRLLAARLAVLGAT